MLIYIRATITSDSGGSYINASNMTIHTEYIHHIAVDGNIRYGRCMNCFPRRNTGGGSWTANTTSGSRGVLSYCSTAYIVTSIS